MSRPERFHLEIDDAYANGGSTAMRVAIIWILMSAFLSIFLAVFVGGAELSDFSFFGNLSRRHRAPGRTVEVEISDQASGFQYELTDSGAVITSYIGDATELTLPILLGGKLVTGIGNAAFVQARSVISLTVPGSYLHVPIAAFAGCLSLEELTLREGVSTIGSHAFSFCRFLQEVYLPKSLKRIASDAFPEDCKATFHVVEGSYAEEWCHEKGFKVER